MYFYRVRIMTFHNIMMERLFLLVKRTIVIMMTHLHRLQMEKLFHPAKLVGLFNFRMYQVGFMNQTTIAWLYLFFILIKLSRRIYVDYFRNSRVAQFKQ